MPSSDSGPDDNLREDMMSTAPSMLGRRWLIRLDPYGPPAAGVTVIKCRGGLCPPFDIRYRDPVLARTKAMEHVRHHIAQAGPPNAQARCRCRHEGCSWHAAAAVVCTQAIALVLIPDRVGRLWVIAETCTACAAAVPRSKVLRFASPSTFPAPQTTAGGPPPVLAPGPRRNSNNKALLGQRQAADRERAHNCQICAAEALPTPPKPAAEDGFGAFSSVPHGWVVPSGFGDHLLNVLRHLKTARAGHTPEGRLLAVLTSLRAGPGGRFKLISDDLRADRMNLPEWALEELIDSDWIDCSLDQVRAAVRGAPAAECRLPYMEGGGADMGLSPVSRPRVTGWVQRMVAHQSLRDQPAADRLAALYVTASSGANGRAQIGSRTLASMCQLASRELALECLESLRKARWLRAAQPGPMPGTVITTVNQEVAHFVPGGLPTPMPEHPGPRPNPIKLRGREYEVAAWVDAFVQRHGHGPRLRVLVAAHCDENPDTPWPEAWLRGAVQRLADEGWLHLDDGNRWYRTRPGITYQRHIERGQAPRAAHPTALPERKSKQPKAPSPPPARLAPAASPPSDDRPSGLWLIPGAEAILGPRPH
ncbi:hypothetical protein ACIQVR_37515 [Streptomyces xanthochromogenes]|uniref:hypothetical protein n=1 Tax=Streptomyces xanthochromogenes TaxID=67384 RepID=UPI0037FD4D21